MSRPQSKPTRVRQASGNLRDAQVRGPDVGATKKRRPWVPNVNQTGAVLSPKFMSELRWQVEEEDAPLQPET